MHSLILLGLFLIATVNGAPFLGGLNSTKWTPEHILQPDEVILYGEGRMEVVHQSVYHKLLATKGYSETVPDSPKPTHSNTTNLLKRNCDYTTALVTDRSETFIDWDVQMSPVVIGTGAGIDVFVSSGYTATNSISVSGSADWTLIKDKLGLSLGVDYTRSWSTQTVVNIKGTVPEGYSGVMITKPIKTRRYGRTLRGCIGSQEETGTFAADSFEEGSYGGVSWVSGAITMCSKKEFPLSRCSGSGNFI